MSFRTLVLTCLLTLLAAGSARAQAGVFPVQGTNLSAGESAAIGNVMAAAYAYRMQKSVLGPNQLGPVLEQTGSERDAATQLGLAEYIHIDAVRLTTRISLLVTLRNKWGSDLYHVRTTARSLDDMEVVSERVAAALARRTDIEYTRDLDNVMGKETQPRNRVFLEKVIGVRFATVMPAGRHMDHGMGVSAMFDARLEMKDLFIEFGAGLMLRPSSDISEDVSMNALLAQLGASYYLTHSNVSPYIGLGVSPRVFFGDYSGAAFAVGGQLGVMFMRESSTRIYLELRVDQNLIGIKPDEPYQYDVRTEEETTRHAITPTEIGLAAGIGW